MKRPAAAMALLILVAGPAAADTAADAAARNCALHNLAACLSSNDLFWGPQTRSGKATPKHEFQGALAAFLRGAPRLYLGKIGFSVAEVASGALVGPGDHHDRLQDGWFFDGFTPHDAPDRGAVLFDADGNIRLVALLNTDADETGSDPGVQDMNRYRLRIYSHAQADAANIRLLQNWAGYAVKMDHQTDESLVGTQVLTLDGDKWRRAP